jgi:hypothetical protein
VRTRVSLATGIVSCTFTLPARSAAKHARGSLALAVPALPTATTAFAFDVRRRR